MTSQFEALAPVAVVVRLADVRPVTLAGSVLEAAHDQSPSIEKARALRDASVGMLGAVHDHLGVVDKRKVVRDSTIGVAFPTDLPVTPRMRFARDAAGPFPPCARSATVIPARVWRCGRPVCLRRAEGGRSGSSTARRAASGRRMTRKTRTPVARHFAPEAPGRLGSRRPRPARSLRPLVSLAPRGRPCVPRRPGRALPL